MSDMAFFEWCNEQVPSKDYAAVFTALAQLRYCYALESDLARRVVAEITGGEA